MINYKEQAGIHPAMLAIAELVANFKSLDAFYSQLHQAIIELFNADQFAVSLISYDLTQTTPNPKCGSVSVVYPEQYQGADESPICKQLQKLPSYLISLLQSNQQAILLKNNADVFFMEENSLKQFNHEMFNDLVENTGDVLIAPLCNAGQVYGVITVSQFQLSNRSERESLQLMQFVCRQIELAVIRDKFENKTEQVSDSLEKIINERTQKLLTANLKLKRQVEERRKVEAQLYHDANHDALTQLPTRAMFTDRLDYAIKSLKRQPKNWFAVLFIDLDRFKMINDTLGHHAGDLFLIEIAHRIDECVRDNDVLARLGGDEFVVLVNSLQSTEDIEEIALRIIDSISQPFKLEGQLLYSNASIGIAQSRLSYNDAHEIIRDADAAMYQAKSLGRGRYVFFDDSMREQLIANMTLEQELRLAIKLNQFELHYQRISDLSTDKVLGFEVLLRWQHSTRGLLTPSDFLFMAEETGVILDIENWIIEQVCVQLKQWEFSKEYRHVYAAINLSGRNLTQPNQLLKLINTIKNNTIQPERLILEFNEAAFTRHTDLALKGLNKLKEFGVKLALDDYGTSLSSFNLLHNTPFEFLKLDRSFIKTLNHNEKNLLLVQTLQELGMNFGYRIVAEGIESEAMLNKLKQVGCEFGQGFHISRPEKMILGKFSSDADKIVDKYSA